MIMVGMLSVYALAAVGLSMQFMMLVNVLITLYVVGGNALISRFIGQGRKRRASSLLFTLTIFASILSVFVSIIGYFGSEYFYIWMGSELEVTQQGTLYFQIISIGFIFIFLDALFYNALSAAGDTLSSLYIKLFSAFLNAFLNYVLIFGHFGFESYGIEGAAYATVISYAFNVFIYFLLLKRSNIKLNIIPLVRFNDVVRVYKVGFSAALDRGISSVSFLVFVAIIAMYGTTELAGYQVGLRIEGIAFMPGFGFAVAAMALVGQNIGAKNFERAFLLGRISGRIAYVFMGSIGFVLVLVPEYLAQFFTKDIATIRIVSEYLILVGLAQIPLAIMFVYSSSLRGAGDTKTVLKINVLSLWLLRVIPSYIAYYLGYEVIVIFIIMNIETLIKGVVYYYIYNQKKWLYTKV